MEDYKTTTGMKPNSPTMTPPMTTTHMYGEDGYTDEYGNMDGGYDHESENDTYDHDNGDNNGDYGDDDGDYSNDRPMEGECSREAMKDWRHAMKKWQESYKGKFLKINFKV